MTKTVRFELKTLPGSGIWTGGSDHTTMTSIKGSSLLGGMRFWTEAFLRSFGHEVCDCTHEKKKEVYGQDKDVCAACHVFGCTGLARAFTLRIEPEGNVQGGQKIEKCVPIFEAGGKRYYYSLSQGWRGSLALALSCRRPLSWPLSREKGEVCLPPEMLPAVFLMLEYGTLGALDQYGCGLVGMTNREALSAVVKEAALPVEGQAKPGAGLADLKDFYFFKGKLDGAALQKKVPGAISMKKDENQRVQGQAGNASRGEALPGNFAHIVRLRRLLREAMRPLRDDAAHTALRHWVCGYMPQGKGGGVAVGSHVSLGVTEGGQLYGWGWMPEKGIEGISASVWPGMRQQALDDVKKALGSVCPNLTWKEFQSARDAASPREWRAYVEAMLKTPWREE